MKFYLEINRRRMNAQFFGGWEKCGLLCSGCCPRDLNPDKWKKLDVMFELQQDVSTVSTQLNASDCCFVIGWLEICVNDLFNRCT